MGGKEETTPYLKDDDGNKIYSDDGKANLLKNIWTDIFQISPEENQDFDQENETIVANFLQRNQNRTKPYPFSDLTRLDPENPLTKPLQLFNIKLAIRNMKDKCPGSSGIRKSILEKMPEIAIKKFINILNHALSMAYFPQKFKEALLCFALLPNWARIIATPITTVLYLC